MRARTAFTALILMLTLGACDMTLRFSTVLEADGSGSFAVGMLLDREAREQFDALAEGFDGAGLDSVFALFDGLEDLGWVVERTEPDGGLALEATSSFQDSADFDRVLADLRAAREGGEGTVAAGAFSLDLQATRSFLRSGASFSGSIDTSVPNPTPEQEQLIEFARGVLSIEVRAELPGAVGEVEGGGTVGDGVVIWRPLYGTASTFSATSSSFRVGSLLALLVPMLGVLGVLGWALLGRRRRPAPAAAPAPGAIRWEGFTPNGGASAGADELERMLRDEPATNGHQRHPIGSGEAPNEPPAEPPVS